MRTLDAASPQPHATPSRGTAQSFRDNSAATRSSLSTQKSYTALISIIAESGKQRSGTDPSIFLVPLLVSCDASASASASTRHFFRNQPSRKARSPSQTLTQIAGSCGPHLSERTSTWAGSEEANEACFLSAQ